MNTRIMTNGVLLCPHCGGDYLRHQQIDVFNRAREDSADGLAITIRGCAEQTSTDAQEGNPSHRRDGMRIMFLCEGCDQMSHLTIVQHKGQTFMEWEQTR